MKILVIDDSYVQREAAKKALFTEHDLTIAYTFAQARKLLTPQRNDEKVKIALKAAGYSEDFDAQDASVTDERRAGYYEIAYAEPSEATYDYPEFDAVMTDLMMPGEKGGLSQKAEIYTGEPTPYGFAIALLALKAGIPHIAIVSNGQADDGNHHNHPILMACDALEGTIIEGQLTASVGYNCPHMNEEKLPDVDKPYHIKDWATVLKRIIED